MGFERYYQVKILSKQLNFKRNFSTLVPNTKYQIPNTNYQILQVLSLILDS